jgi:hypothetical protein
LQARCAKPTAAAPTLQRKKIECLQSDLQTVASTPNSVASGNMQSMNSSTPIGCGDSSLVFLFHGQAWRDCVDDECAHTLSFFLRRVDAKTT